MDKIAIFSELNNVLTQAQIDSTQINGNTVTIPAPNSFIKKRLEERTLPPLQQRFPDLTFNLTIDSSLLSSPQPPSETPTKASQPKTTNLRALPDKFPLFNAPRTPAQPKHQPLPLYFSPTSIIMPPEEQKAFVTTPENAPLLATLPLSYNGPKTHRCLLATGPFGAGLSTAMRFVASKPGKKIIYVPALDFLKDMPFLLRENYGSSGKEAIQRLGRAAELLIVDDAHILGGRRKDGNTASPETKKALAEILTLRAQNALPTWIGFDQPPSQLQGLTPDLERALSYFSPTTPLAMPSYSAKSEILESQARKISEELKGAHKEGRYSPQILRGRALSKAVSALSRLHPAKGGLHSLVGSLTSGLTNSLLSGDVYTADTVRRTLEDEGILGKQLNLFDMRGYGEEYFVLAKASRMLGVPQLRILQCGESSGPREHLGAAITYGTSTNSFGHNPQYALLVFEARGKREEHLRSVLPEMQSSQEVQKGRERLKHELKIA